MYDVQSFRTDEMNLIFEFANEAYQGKWISPAVIHTCYKYK